MTPGITCFRLALFISAALLLGGCLSSNQTPVGTPSSGTSTTPVPVEDRSEPTPNATTDSQAPAPTNPGKTQVTVALLEQSASAQNAGNHQQAITYVERAIRINPRRADLWVQLAQLQLAVAKPSAAENYARKAITLAGTRMDWMRDAWLVIADAKAAQGDEQAALAIRERWRVGRG